MGSHRVSLQVLVPSLAGAVLVSSTFGLLLFGFDYSLVWLSEIFAEMVGLIPTGWAAGHIEWTLGAASILTLPLVAAVFVLSWRQIYRVEMTLADDASVSS